MYTRSRTVLLYDDAIEELTSGMPNVIKPGGQSGLLPITDDEINFDGIYNNCQGHADASNFERISIFIINNRNKFA